MEDVGRGVRTSDDKKETLRHCATDGRQRVRPRLRRPAQGRRRPRFRGRRSSISLAKLEIVEVYFWVCSPNSIPPESDAIELRIVCNNERGCRELWVRSDCVMVWPMLLFAGYIIRSKDSQPLAIAACNSRTKGVLRYRCTASRTHRSRLPIVASKDR